MKEKAKQSLIELIKDNPNMPIFAWVECEIVGGDEYGRWLGQLGSAEIREYAKVEPFGYNDQTMVFKDDTEDYFNHLIESKYFEVEPDDKAIEMAEKEIKKLTYKKAIFINIDLPNNI